MKKKISKKEAKKQIEEFFQYLPSKSPKEVKKIKKLAMSHKIPLKDKRKLFCKKCMNPYQMPSIRIRNDKIRITCDNCEYKSRWKVE